MEAIKTFEIEVESNTEMDYWGGEMTDADWERWEAACRAAIEAKWPDAEVSFSRSYQQFHHSNAVGVSENEQGVDAEDVQEILSRVFAEGF